MGIEVSGKTEALQAFLSWLRVNQSAKNDAGGAQEQETSEPPALEKSVRCHRVPRHLWDAKCIQGTEVGPAETEAILQVAWG